MLHVDPADRTDYLRWARFVDGRGVRFTGELIHEVYRHLPRKGRPARRVDFTKAVFPDKAGFGGARFGDGSSFAGAAFGRHAFFRGAVFGDDITFVGATFGMSPNFRGAFFSGRSHFKGAKFGDHAYFRNARFGGRATFDEATFGRSASFVGLVRFEGAAFFDSAVFGDDLSFGKVLFIGPGMFTNATFGARARFNAFSHEILTYANARFGSHAEIDFAGEDLDLLATDFTAGGRIRAWGTDINLSRAKFGAPFLLTRRHPVEGTKKSSSGVVLVKYPDPAGFETPLPTPRVVSLNEADVCNLVVDQVDLGRCQFTQVHNLDQIKVGSSDQFLLPDKKFGRTRRRVVAEEDLWRSSSGDRRAEARQVEQTYRALRKAFEDLKNEPGSADFYYGEMEMRRRGTESRGERFLLYCYWLLAGYGLRAWRAFVALAVTIAVATVVFATAGFAGTATTTYVPDAGGTYVQTAIPGPKPGWLDAISYSLHSITSLIRPTGTIPLTGIGNYTELVLRILGPVLLGLAALSVRGRVKR
ncbi:pentapeptide repeat-containing protein [Lentzea sp. NPDC054927]